MMKRERDVDDQELGNASKRLDDSLLLNYGVRPRFKATRNITRADIWNMCNALGDHVDLEKRSEGGLLFYDGKDGYNSIRFCHIHASDIDKALWKNDHSNIVLEKGEEIGTVFKTFIYNTHVNVHCKPWTYENVHEVYEALAANGLKRIKKYDPKKKDFDIVPDHISFV